MMSCLYQEYLMEGFITHHEQHINCPQVIHDHHQRHLVKIVCSNGQVILTQIPSAFNAGVTRCIFNRSVHSSLTSMEYSTSPWLVLLLIEPWRSSNTYHGLMMSYGSCCFRVMIVWVWCMLHDAENSSFAGWW